LFVFFAVFFSGLGNIMRWVGFFLEDYPPSYFGNDMFDRLADDLSWLVATFFCFLSMALSWRLLPLEFISGNATPLSLQLPLASS